MRIAHLGPAGLLLGMSLLPVTPGVAVATGAPTCAKSAPEYKFGNPVHDYDDLVTSSHGPGGSRLTITLPAGSKLATDPGADLPTREKAFIAAAREQVASGVARVKVQPATHSFSWRVPVSWRTGYLHAGGDRYRTPWQFGRVTRTCRFAVTAQGLAELAYHLPAAWHNKRPAGGGNLG